jgi:hypothetical protein
MRSVHCSVRVSRAAAFVALAFGLVAGVSWTPRAGAATASAAAAPAASAPSVAASPPASGPSAADVPTDPRALARLAARFAPVDVVVDLTALPENERFTLAKLVEASRVLDGLYLRQRQPANDALLQTLAADRTPLGAARLDLFLLEKGPWSSLDENRAFVPGVGPKPPGASFYPAGATRDDVERWIATLPEASRAQATGYFTTIRRAPDGAFVAVPYSLEYQTDLARMAALLREAARATRQPTLRRFLQLRADAFLSNDYYASDVAWMDLDATIEPTIGPYEVYDDEWFNYKASFESFVTLTDAAESAKLERFSRELQWLEDRLPIDPKFRRAKLGGQAPIRVVNVLYSAGDGNHGVQSAAYNLPNDERVVAAKGSKRVLLRNFQQAKFDRVLAPIAAVALAPSDRALVAFEPFFTHVLMHELMHGLGPQTIVVDGRSTTVRLEMKDLGGTLEEAKADVAGLWALAQLMQRGVLDAKAERATYVTYVASVFRTLRFGLTEAHARGTALQVNWLLDRHALRVAADGTFAVDVPAMRRAIADLTRRIMTLQATGDHAGVRAWFGEAVVIRPEVQRVIDRLGDVPVDIRPRFVTADRLVEDAEGLR